MNQIKNKKTGVNRINILYIFLTPKKEQKINFSSKNKLYEILKKNKLKKILFIGLWIICEKCTNAPTIKHPPTILPRVTNPKAKVVAELLFPVSALGENKFYYKFAKGDTIIFNAWVIQGNDISEVSVIKWPNTTKFHLWAVPAVENIKIFVETTSVYLFLFRNSSWSSSKSYKFTLHRIPTEERFIVFNTAVEWDTFYDTTYVTVTESTLVDYDTIPEEIINTQLKLGSQLSGRTRSYIEISFPKKTSYWVYWLGVGEEAAQGLKEMAYELPKTATMLGITDPVAAFAVGLISKLFTLNKGYDINFYFISDYENLNKFMNEETFYALKAGKRVITDYGKMEKPTKGTIYLGLDNSYSIMTPKIVTVKIVAVKIIPKYEKHTVQKPVITPRIVPKLE